MNLRSFSNVDGCLDLFSIFIVFPGVRQGKPKISWILRGLFRRQRSGAQIKVLHPFLLTQCTSWVLCITKFAGFELTTRLHASEDFSFPKIL